MKRLFSALLLISILWISFSGCYSVKSGSLDDVLGTYEMSVYSLAGSETDGIASHDYLEEKHVVCYLVIASETEGYYYYADDDTHAACYTVELRLTESTDEEEAGLYSYVEFRTASTEEWEKYGIFVSDLLFGDHKLNRTDRTYAGSVLKGDYRVTSTLTRKFKRISRKTTLATVERKVGDVSPLPIV